MLSVVVLFAAGCAGAPRPDQARGAEYRWYRELAEFPLGLVKAAGGVVLLPFVAPWSLPPEKSGSQFALQWIESSVYLLNPLENDYPTWHVEETTVTDEQVHRMQALNYLEAHVRLLE